VAAGLCGKPPARKCCEVIDSSFGFVRPEARVPAVRAFTRQLDESSRIYTATNLVSPRGNSSSGGRSRTPRLRAVASPQVGLFRDPCTE
jgi:hypothetical protein